MAIHDFDRRWIFLAMGLIVVGLYAAGITAALPHSTYVDSFYDTIEDLPEGSIVMLSADFDPASAAELLPMYQGVIHHLLSRKLRIVNVATWPAAPPYTQQEFARIAPEYGVAYGVDWVELGFLPGDDVAMGNIGQSLRTAYPRETREGRPYDEVPLLSEVSERMQGVSVLITMSAGYPGILEWIAQVGGRYEVTILAGTTAVQTPDLFAFYPKQVAGFLGAATGATQYLQLVNEIVTEGAVTGIMEENQKRMLVQSWGHMLIIVLIVIGNVIYFATRSRGRRAA
jgi:hypothetical protein